MGDTRWRDTIKHININKYWYHSLCSPYDDSYFNGMVQKKCANSQELWIGQKQFFCQTEEFVEPRAFLIGVLSNAATIRLSSLEFSRRQWHISATAGRYPWKKKISSIGDMWCRVEQQPEHLDGSKQRAEFWAIDLLPPHRNFTKRDLQHLRNLEIITLLSNIERGILFCTADIAEV